MSFLQPGLKEQLSNKHPLYVLAGSVDWHVFGESFKKHYRENFGRPAKPIRLMTALLMLKHIRNLSDESVVEQWSENAYYQYFSGAQTFTAKAPCIASELVHGKGGKEDKASINTTVQEKNITYPTDTTK